MNEKDSKKTMAFIICLIFYVDNLQKLLLDYLRMMKLLLYLKMESRKLYLFQKRDMTI